MRGKIAANLWKSKRYVRCGMVNQGHRTVEFPPKMLLALVFAVCRCATRVHRAGGRVLLEPQRVVSRCVIKALLDDKL